ncbi:M28 family peptidase [Croceiramulus getboli]|nr:M20/M25/M40 family metallo-hydrolase [Flavobacteriaceae bacterium YJPT1-3]
MKTYRTAASLLLLIGITYFAFFNALPQKLAEGDLPPTEFSLTRALKHVKAMSEEPHYLGSRAHDQVRDYLMQSLRAMDLEPKIQEGFSFNKSWGGLAKPENILARISGTNPGKALLLMSHYDSAPHSASHGAGDAASGVAVLLEGVRTFLAQGKRPKNDIIILFTDGEELGLNGANLFTNQHPWAKEVALALNFEARGSGGASSMILETNQGNERLIKAFAKANPSHPVASSLAYSVYKKLPNDTDSTVLREEGDIDGYFFAFIDDFFDYHTANDTFDRLDHNSLQHQANYLMPLMNYFADADLTQLKSEKDYVYFDLPFLGTVYYPFSWIWPMILLGGIAFMVLLILGFRRGAYTVKAVAKGFVPFLIALLLPTALSYFLWPLLENFYPGYQDILHGFPYNGYYYIAAVVALTLAVCFYCYAKRPKDLDSAALTVAPLFFWFLICIVVALELEGAAYFIVPFYFGVLLFYLQIKKEKPNLLLNALLCAPGILILAPLIQSFPVALRLESLFISALFTVLLFGLLLPVFGYYKQNKVLALISALLFLGMLGGAHLNSSFVEERPFPNSLNYVYDKDTESAYWATYNKNLDPWTSVMLGSDPEPASENLVYGARSISKYGNAFTYTAKAPVKPLAPSSMYFAQDTLIQDKRHLEVVIYPQRSLYRMDVFMPNDQVFEALELNGVTPKKEDGDAYYMMNRRSDYLVSYIIRDQEPLRIKMILPETSQPSMRVLEYSMDLLDHPNFSVAERPKNTIPMPFIVNDAIVISQTFDLQQPEPQASLKTDTDE